MNRPEVAPLYAAHVADRRATTEAALAAAGFDRLLLHSGRPFTYFADDQDAPFHPTPHFAHWAPVEGPHHLLDVRPGRTPRLFRVTPRDYWYEPPTPAPDYVRSVVDVVDVATPEEAWKAAGDGARTAFVGEDAAAAAAHGVGPGAVNPPALLARLDWARSYKSAYEVETVLEANRIASHGFLAAEAAFRAGRTEMEIHHAYLSAVGTMEEALPYPTIIGLNERAATLHYHGKRGREAGPGAVMLVDAGAPLRGYGSDITRTFLTDAADPAFTSLVRGLDALQRQLAREARPGRPYLDLHVAAHRGIASLLREAGVFRVDAEEAFARGLTRPFFPHGLGHFLGVQVHDVAGRQAAPEGGTVPPPPEYPSLRTTRTIEEGMLFTIEPGVYFIPILLEPLRAGSGASAVDWGVVDRLLPSGGVRIEDDVFVGREENRNLTRPWLPA